MNTQEINFANHSEKGVTYYAIIYREKYFGNKSHEDKTDNIEDAMRFTKKEAIKFIESVPGASARPIPSTMV